MLQRLLAPATRLQDVGEVAIKCGDAVLVGPITPELKRLLGNFERLVEAASLSEKPRQVVERGDRGSRVLKLPPLLKTLARRISAPTRSPWRPATTPRTLRAWARASASPDVSDFLNASSARA